MKTKWNYKIVLVIAVLLIAGCTFNISIVHATETETATTETTMPIAEETTPTETQKTTPNKETLNLIDTIITLNNLKEIQFRELENEDNELKQIIMSKLEENNIDMTNYDVSLEFRFYDFNWSIYRCNVSIVEKNSTREKICSKEISIRYSNTWVGTMDMEASGLVSELIASIDNPYWYYDIDKDIDIKPNNEDVILEKFDQEYVENLNSFVSDYGVEIIFLPDATSTGLWGCGHSGMMYFFKDDISYGHEYKYFNCYYEIVVPSNIADTDQAYINNALPRLKEFTSKISPNYDVSKITLTKDYGDFYNIVEDGEVVSQIVIHKANTIMVYDGISVSSNANVTLSAEPINNDFSIYKEMQTKLAEKGYQDIFNAYELKLTSGNLEDGLELTFDVGTENNGKKAIVLHKKQDGTYEEFERTVENGKIKITVTELSPFMIALKGDRKLDNEPKTGVADATILASTIAIISIGGLAILKFKK